MNKLIKVKRTLFSAIDLEGLMEKMAKCGLTIEIGCDVEGWHAALFDQFHVGQVSKWFEVEFFSSAWGALCAVVKLPEISWLKVLNA